MIEIFFGSIGIIHYLSLSAILFSIGIAGVCMNRKNIITLLMSVELMLLSVIINFTAFSFALRDLAGQVFAVFILAIAAAEAAIGLAILVVYSRRHENIEIDSVSELQG